MDTICLISPVNQQISSLYCDLKNLEWFGDVQQQLCEEFRLFSARLQNLLQKRQVPFPLSPTAHGDFSAQITALSTNFAEAADFLSSYSS